MSMTLYRLAVAPLITLGVFLLAPFHRKIRAVLKLKLKTRPPFTPLQAPVWIHAASGEFEYAKAVIREIKTLAPRTPIVVTYSSASFVQAIEQFPGVDLAMPLPLDLPGPCASFLQRIKPRCLLIARTDLWPEMLHQARRLRVPVVLFAYTQREPGQMSAIARGVRRWLLEGLTQVQCVSDQDAKNVRALGTERPVAVLGDPRYDQVQFRLKHPKPLKESLRPLRPALVAGSTWPQDEKILLEALAQPLQEQRLQLIMVPHEPSEAHIQALEQALNQYRLSYQRYSRAEHFRTAQVLIVDQVGILAELYQWATIAFVGGSFRGSVHSVMEPLGTGCVTLVGPFFKNNREAMEFAQIPIGPCNAVQECADAQSFQSVTLTLLADGSERKARVLNAFNQRLGASRRLYEAVFNADSLAPGGPG